MTTPNAKITSARPNRDYPDAIVVTVTCPLCGTTHLHGIGAGEVSSSSGYYGHRVSDCTDPNNSGYYVTDPSGMVAECAQRMQATR